MNTLIGELNTVENRKSSVMHRYYSAVRYFAYSYFYYYKDLTAEQ